MKRFDFSNLAAAAQRPAAAPAPHTGLTRAGAALIAAMRNVADAELERKANGVRAAGGR